MSAQVWIAVLVGLAAMIDDLMRRHIANWIPAAAIAGGFGWQIGRDGWHGALTALGGTAAGFCVFLVFYLLGGMGGGDVKLMAGFGALLGAGLLLQAALWTGAIGGLMAVAAIGWKAIRKSRGRHADGTAPSEEQRLHDASIPYAPAITLGVWLSLLSRA